MSDYEFMDPRTMAVFGMLDGCAGWIAGLTLLVVGFVTVRKAHPTAGYLAGGAGALQLVSSCCASWQEPAYVWLDVSPPQIVGTLSAAVSFLCFLGMAGLVIGAAVMLAKAVPAGGAS